MTAPPPPYSEKDPYRPYPQPMQQTYFNPALLGEFPSQCTCPQCSKAIVTRTQKKNGILAWLICLLLFFFGFWCCCCIPFCVDACKDTEHYCPNCGALIGCKKQI